MGLKKYRNEKTRESLIANFFLLMSALTPILPYLNNHRFYYIDDNQSYFLPNLRFLSLNFNWNSIVFLNPGSGASGNLAINPGSGFFSLIPIILSQVTKQIQDMAVLGLVVALFYHVIFLSGLVFLCRRLKLSKLNASIVCLLVSTSYFYIFWISSYWQGWLASICFLPWVWGSFYGTLRPRDLFVISSGMFFLVQGGWPSVILQSLIVLLVLTLEGLFIQKTARESLLRLIAAFVGGLAASAPWIWLYGSLSWGPANAGVRNSGAFVPNLSDFLLTSIPAGGTVVNSWFTVSKGPIFYISVFSIAILAYFRLNMKEFTKPGILSLTTILILGIAATQGPSDAGSFRWPLRFFSLVVIAFPIFIMYLRQNGKLSISNKSHFFFVTSTFFAFWIAFSRTPQNFVLILITIIFSILVVTSWIRFIKIESKIIANIQIFVVSYGIFMGLLLAFPQNPDVTDWGMPTKIQQNSRYDNPGLLILRDASHDIYSDGIYVGQTMALAGRYSGFGYTSTNQRHLEAAYCANSLGIVCPAAVNFLGAVDFETNLNWHNLLGINQIVAENGAITDRMREILPRWKEKSWSKYFSVFTDPGSPKIIGDITFSEPTISKIGLVKMSDDGSYQSYLVTGGGKIVMRNVYWPGWRYKIDGVALPVKPYKDKILQIDVSNIDEPRLLEIYYRPPYWRSSLSLTIAGVLISLILPVVFRRSKSKNG